MRQRLALVIMGETSTPPLTTMTIIELYKDIQLFVANHIVIQAFLITIAIFIASLPFYRIYCLILEKRHIREAEKKHPGIYNSYRTQKKQLRHLYLLYACKVLSFGIGIPLCCVLCFNENLALGIMLGLFILCYRVLAYKKSPRLRDIIQCYENIHELSMWYK